MCRTTYLHYACQHGQKAESLNCASLDDEMDCHTSKTIQVQEECGKCQAEKTIERVLQEDKNRHRSLQIHISTIINDALESMATCSDTTDEFFDNIKPDALATMDEKNAHACRQIYDDYLKQRSHEIFPFVIILAKIGLTATSQPMATQDLIVLQERAIRGQKVMPTFILHEMGFIHKYLERLPRPLEDIFKDPKEALRIIGSISSCGDAARAELNAIVAELGEGVNRK